jgi:putative nucleotidyltransferase with HDIG domain
MDRPLLQQLCAVAPGTYAHSIMVGTLAEAGAQAIGADALLCKVGGYYHDIGKMKRPEFFVENQRNGNVHGRLSPSLSAIFITAHVRDGLEMAKEYKLPMEIRDIIASHHGTTLIGYFYHQALTDCGGSDEAPPGLEERFRYPGPKPGSREAAIVMLADSVEAATRCLERPKKERLEAEIARLVSGKIEDGQFDECSITFKDIKGISDAFVHVLEAMMHGRVSYPKLAVEDDDAAPADTVAIGGSLPLAALPASVRAHSPENGELVRKVQNRFQDPEEFYASFGDEPAIKTDSDEEASSGGQSAAAHRAAVRSGSQRPADR